MNLIGEACLRNEKPLLGFRLSTPIPAGGFFVLKPNASTASPGAPLRPKCTTSVALGGVASEGVAGARGGVAPQAAEAALENNANNFSPLLTRGFTGNVDLTREDTADSLRVSRYRRRGLLWEVSALERVRKCGRTRHDTAGVALRQTASGVVGFAGVCTCGSVWVCPVCSSKIMARRALEIGGAVAAWQSQSPDHHVIFSTFTMSHHKGQRLSYLWGSLSTAWNKVTGGKAWITDKERFGVEGWCRVVEVTDGPNGWHVHVHALLFLVSASLDVESLHRRMFARWSRALVRAGLAEPSLIGQDAHLVNGPGDAALAAYFTKAVDGAHRIGLELTQSQTKKARRRHSTVPTWGLLDEVEETGDLTRWEEWELGSKGRRQISWSKGLRERLGLRREESDEELAAEEVGTSADNVMLITAFGWNQLCTVPADLGRLLDVTSTEGLEGARAFLDARGVEYQTI